MDTNADSRTFAEIAREVGAEEPWPGLPGGLQNKILIAIGQASTCWDRDGVFDADQAIEVAKNLAWEIDCVYSYLFFIYSGEEQ